MLLGGLALDTQALGDLGEIEHLRRLRGEAIEKIGDELASTDALELGRVSQDRVPDVVVEPAIAVSVATDDVEGKPAGSDELDVVAACRPKTEAYLLPKTEGV